MRKGIRNGMTILFRLKHPVTGLYVLWKEREYKDSEDYQLEYSELGDFITTADDYYRNVLLDIDISKKNLEVAYAMASFAKANPKAQKQPSASSYSSTRINEINYYINELSSLILEPCSLMIDIVESAYSKQKDELISKAREYREKEWIKDQLHSEFEITHPYANMILSAYENYTYNNNFDYTELVILSLDGGLLQSQLADMGIKYQAFNGYSLKNTGIFATSIDYVHLLELSNLKVIHHIGIQDIQALSEQFRLEFQNQ